MLEAIATDDYDFITKKIATFPYRDCKENFFNHIIYISRDVKSNTMLSVLEELQHYTQNNTIELTNLMLKFTPLSFAIAIDNLKMAEFLYTQQRGGWPNLEEPLHAALTYNPKLVPRVVAWGAKITDEIIVKTAEDNNVAGMQELFKQGADLKIKSPKHKNSLHLPWMQSSLLHLACTKRNCLSIAQFLLDHGVYIDEPDAQGCTPLHHAAGAHLESDGRRSYVDHHPNQEGLEFLLDHSANVKATTHDGRSVIECVGRNHAKYVKKLLCSGAPYPTTNMHKEMIQKLLTPTVTTFYHSYVDNLIQENTDAALAIIQKIKCRKLNKGDNDLYNLTPLHWAVIRENEKVVDALLAHKTSAKLQKVASSMPIISHFVKKPITKINVNCRDSQGRTPLMWAALLDNDHMYLKLRQYKANRMTPDNNGKIALNYAADFKSIKSIDTHACQRTAQ